MIKSIYFKVQDFINPTTYNRDGDKSIELMDAKIIAVAEFVREDTGLPVTINNWYDGGQYEESGLRDKDSKTGAPKSTHKLGKGVDLKIKGWDGQKWYDYVKANSKKLYDLGLRRIEDKKISTTWCHMDTKEHGLKDAIQVVDRLKITETIK